MRSRQRTHEPDTPYQYPEHLRAALDDLPAAPGIYVFHGASDSLPLYIGKSVNLRQRVLSHLRNVDEARMLRQTVRISHERTAGEVGALLLEASLIKLQQPLLNQKLRRNRQLCSLRLVNGVPEVVYSKDVNFATEPGLYGLFASRHAALDALRALADEHALCYGALGLEKLAAGRPCFRAMLKQCAGLCCGREDAQAHRQRLLTALAGLQLFCWPYAGAVGLVEQFGGGSSHVPHARDRQIHVLRNWCYLGSVELVDQAGGASEESGLQKARALTQQAPGFDADGYKILCRPLLEGSAQIVPL